MDEWVIFCEEVFPHFGICLDREKTTEFAKAIKENSDALSGMGFDMIGGRSEESIDYKSKCERLEEELSDTKKELDGYISSVARRHNCEKSDVILENDKVMIYKGL